MRTEEARPRWVRGTPVYAAAPRAAVTPGTISKGIPASARARASSPPRPKRSGSPPLRRTTRRPRLASSIMRTTTSSWPTAARPRSRPTSTRWIHSLPRTVTRSGRPGPAPTSTTRGSRTALPPEQLADPAGSQLFQRDARQIPPRGPGGEEAHGHVGRLRGDQEDPGVVPEEAEEGLLGGVDGIEGPVPDRRAAVRHEDDGPHPGPRAAPGALEDL